jgi:hypothetical protein
MLMPQLSTPLANDFTRGVRDINLARTFSQQLGWPPSGGPQCSNPRRGTKMESPARRRTAVSVAPMIFGLIAAQRAAPHVRTVDFLLLFAGGIAVGVSLMGLIQMLGARRS